MSLGLQMLQQRQALRVLGGLTRSIFPRAEALLMSEGDYQKALQFVGSRKKMDRYQSVMDFLLCELFVRYRGQCFRYYDGNGPRLAKVLSVEEVLSFDEQLTVALEVAVQMLEEERRASWAAFRGRVLEVIAA